MDSQCIIGQMFPEYLKGQACKENGDFSTREQCCVLQDHFPTTKVVAIIMSLSSRIPTKNRVIDDYMLRVLLKATYTSGQRSLDNPTPSSFSKFSTKFVVAEGCVKAMYRRYINSIIIIIIIIIIIKDCLEHLKVLDLKTDKRRKDWLKSQQRQARNYQVVSRQKQFLTILEASGLPSASNKHGKLMEVQRRIIVQRVQNSTQEEETLRGGGGTQQMLIQGGSAPRSKPLPFIYHFSTLSYTIF